MTTADPGFVFVEGPWPGQAIPPSSTRIWQQGARIWVLRMHDDPTDFKPVFVESFEAPHVNAPAVPLGYYAYTDRGWNWREVPSGEL